MCRTKITAILSIAVLVFFATAAHPQTVPYITDVMDDIGIEQSPVRGKTDNGQLRLLGTFKLFNPDTVPFYLWVSYDNGGKLTHTRRGDNSSTIRLVDLELRYKNSVHRTIVKEFPKDGYFGGPPSMRRRSVLGSTSGGSYGRFGKKKPHRGQPEYEAFYDEGARRRYRGMSTVELVFWREDVQPSYEMEIWGVLYAPDVIEASVPGRYVENMWFEVEVAR